MNYFRFKLIEPSGQISSGIVKLPYREAMSAISHLEKDGSTTVYVKKLGRLFCLLLDLSSLRMRRKLPRSLQVEFLHNVSLMIGAGIGLIIIIQGYHFAGFVMLIPHTVNFLMYVYWRIKNKLKPNDPKYKITKFGGLRKDGTLRVPNALTLKWVLPHKYRITEKQAVLVMYLLTIVFCVIGFFVPG